MKVKQKVEPKYCRNCKHAVFPAETAPWGTCCLGRLMICKSVAKKCIHFEGKEKEDGKDK